MSGAGSVQRRLAAATAAAHARLDALPVLSRLAAPELSLPQYVESLNRLYGIVAPVEAAVSDVLSRDSVGSFTLPSAGRAQALARDLRVFGIDPGAVPLCDWPATGLPRAALFGVAYVFEGSALGGRFLARGIGARLGLGVESGLAYLTGAGPALDGRWERVRALLDALLPEADFPVAAAGADATFRAYIDWLS